MLELSRVSAAYGRARVLFDLDLRVGRGEVVALLGRNGAGKSTTLKTVMGLLRPLGGTIRFAGESIAGLDPYRIARRGLAYVPEDRRIFTALTVAENLEVGRQPPRPDCPQWSIERVCALFPSLARLLDRRGGRISGGEQQMLAIARSLMGNPAAVLLDEPSEGLAPLVVEHMAGLVRRLKEAGLAVLLAEQNLGFAQSVADRAYVLEAGQVRGHGTLDELAARPALREQYLAV